MDFCHSVKLVLTKLQPSSFLLNWTFRVTICTPLISLIIDFFTGFNYCYWKEYRDRGLHYKLAIHFHYQGLPPRWRVNSKMKYELRFAQQQNCLKLVVKKHSVHFTKLRATLLKVDFLFKNYQNRPKSAQIERNGHDFMDRFW